MNTLPRLLVVLVFACLLADVSEAKSKVMSFGAVDITRVSIAIDPAGYPHVAYRGQKDYGLHHARFDGRRWQSELVDVSQYYGNAMAIDAEGHIHIVYGAERVNGTSYTYPLVHASFDGSSWQVTDLSVNGFNPRLKLDSDGHLHVLFMTSSTLGYGEYDGASWQFEDTGLPWSWYSNGLAIDSDGNAHVSYSVNFSGIFYATNESGDWESTQLVSGLFGATAIALDGSDNPHVVAGLGGALVQYSQDDEVWTDETIADFDVLDPKIQASVESGIEMVVDSRGRVQVLAPVYFSSGNRGGDVGVLVFDDGVGWNGIIVDAKDANYSAIALDEDDVPNIAWVGNRKGKWTRIVLPDLAAAWGAVSVVGMKVSGTLNVTNRALEKSSKTTASVWLSADDTLDGGDTLLPVKLKVKSLAAGATAAITVSFQYPGTLAGQQLIAVIDPDVETADRNRVDNTSAVPLSP